VWTGFWPISRRELMAAAQPIPLVVQQHVEEAAALRNQRTVLLDTPNASLEQLKRADSRLDAHLDGIAVSGEFGSRLVEKALETAGLGEVFVATVTALEGRDPVRLDKSLALAGVMPNSKRAVISAIGWLSPAQLQGTVASLLESVDPLRRMIGIAACASHGVNPGLAPAKGILHPHPLVRARALRTAGELGTVEAVHACVAAVGDDDRECSFWSARSSVLLGSGGVAVELLANCGLVDGPYRLRSFCLALQAMDGGSGHKMLQKLAKEPAQRRWLIQGSGIVGDCAYIPWLMKQMNDDISARLAGEAFSLITGVDLAQNSLEGKPPEGFVSGPNDDPDDPNVDMDPDDRLPWPDVERIEGWWSSNGHRFQKGTRYFIGLPVTREHCIEVLKTGYQRQRILAAHYLCLLEPGTPLFNTSAPAWRQQRLLAKMS
jgi:uncharacterized protein (TIGR02270 family)